MDLRRFDLRDDLPRPATDRPRAGYVRGGIYSDEFKATLSWEYFLQEQKEQKAICEKHGVPSSTLLAIIREMGVYLPPSQANAPRKKRAHLARDAEVLGLLQQGLTHSQISRQTGYPLTSLSTIVSRLEKSGQWIRRRSANRISAQLEYEILTLHEEGVYWPAEIVRQLNVSMMTVVGLIDRAYAQGRVSKPRPTRKKSYRMRRAWLDSFLAESPDTLELARLYTEELLSLDELAERLGIKALSVRNRLELAGVKIRTPAEAQRVAIARGRKVAPVFSEEQREKFRQNALGRVPVNVQRVNGRFAKLEG